MKNLECTDIVKHLQANVFYAVFDAESGELKFFEFITFKSYSQWEKEKFNAEFIKEMTFENDIDLLYKAALEAKEKQTSETVIRFKRKDGGFVFIKTKLSLLSCNENEIYCIGTNENVSQEKEYEIIVETIKESPHIGYIIFRENVLYANDYAKKILSISDRVVPLVEVVRSIPKKELQEMLEKRLRGEKFFMYRKNVEILINQRKYIDIYAQTIVYEGKYAGLAIITDQSENVKRNTLLKILNHLSDNIFRFTQKRKYFEKVIEIINKNGYKAYVKFNDLEIGDRCDIKIDRFKIINKKEGEFKSYLVLPIMNNGYLVIFSEYENEFEPLFTKEYLEIQKVINFAVTTIRQNMLMQILKEAIEKSYQWVLITDESGNIIYVNDVVVEMTGYKKEDIIGNTPFIFTADKNTKELYDKLVSHMRARKIFEDLFVGEGKNGEFYLKIKVIPVEVDDNVYFVALGIDMTKEKKLHESLFTDEMTGFLNRKGFLLRAKDFLVDDENYALFLMDIRNFKALNQIKGNVYGNLILKQFAYFLKTFFYEEDLIARIGGDEFAVLMKYDDMSNLAKVLQKLIKKTEKIENTSINIGVALYPKDAEDVYSLIEKAYIALEFAKKEGENSFEFYNEQIQAEVETFLRAKVLINEALKKDKFEYFFQPYYDIKSDKIVGAEALIRIMDENEIITPNYFIDYAEKSGIIKNIETKMFKKLPRYVEILQVPVSFNISAVSFRDEEHIEKLNNLSEIPLTIELTERTVAKNIEYAKVLFERLKDKNFKIAIDDFGTGYSSLSYVKELNFDVLKIDINFIKNIENSYKDLAIVKTIITLAKSLNLKTVAEGVETPGQLNLLKNIGCDVAQGFLIAKPMPVYEAAEFIKTFKGLR